MIEMRPSAAAAYLSLEVTRIGCSRGNGSNTNTGSARRLTTTTAALSRGTIPTSTRREKMMCSPTFGCRQTPEAGSRRGRSQGCDGDGPLWLADLQKTSNYRLPRRARCRLPWSCRAERARRQVARRRAGQLPDRLATASEKLLAEIPLDRPPRCRPSDRNCAAAQRVPDDLGAFRVEITDALLKEGIASPGQLDARLATTETAAELASKLRKNIRDRCVQGLPRKRLAGLVRDRHLTAPVCRC